MAKYIKNPEIVNAVQWLKAEDHDSVIGIALSENEGKNVCVECGRPLSAHGIMKDTIFQGKVCPGRWIVTHEDGRTEYLDDATFQARYSLLKE